MSTGARFKVFMAATSDEERNWIAFHAFEDVIREAAEAASLVNKYDNSTAGERELAMLHPAVSAMLYRLLPKVGVNNIQANAYGIGYALRYGVIELGPDALDGIKNLKDLEDLAERGYEAERAETEMRITELRRKQEAEETRRREARNAARRAARKRQRVSKPR